MRLRSDGRRTREIRFLAGLVLALAAGTSAMAAATARRHGLHVMTRNVADFEPTGVMLINPWDNQ